MFMPACRATGPQRATAVTAEPRGRGALGAAPVASHVRLRCQDGPLVRRRTPRRSANTAIADMTGSGHKGTHSGPILPWNDESFSQARAGRTLAPPVGR